MVLRMMLRVAVGLPVSLPFVGTVMAPLALQDSPGDFEKARLEGLDIHQHQVSGRCRPEAPDLGLRPGWALSSLPS